MLPVFPSMIESNMILFYRLILGALPISFPAPFI